MEPVTLDLKGCARCGEDHGEITFQPLTNPSRFGVFSFTHWTICPATGEPVMYGNAPRPGNQVFACSR